MEYKEKLKQPIEDLQAQIDKINKKQNKKLQKKIEKQKAKEVSIEKKELPG